MLQGLSLAHPSLIAASRAGPATGIVSGHCSGMYFTADLHGKARLPTGKSNRPGLDAKFRMQNAKCKRNCTPPSTFPHHPCTACRCRYFCILNFEFCIRSTLVLRVDRSTQEDHCQQREHIGLNEADQNFEDRDAQRERHANAQHHQRDAHRQRAFGAHRAQP